MTNTFKTSALKEVNPKDESLQIIGTRHLTDANNSEKLAYAVSIGKPFKGVVTLISAKNGYPVPLATITHHIDDTFTFRAEELSQRFIGSCSTTLAKKAFVFNKQFTYIIDAYSYLKMYAKYLDLKPSTFAVHTFGNIR